jgi:hypothetical protein
MLKDAHKSQELIAAVTSAVKDERWGDAERGLKDLLAILDRLMRGVGDKTRETMMAPKADKGDRG